MRQSFAIAALLLSLAASQAAATTATLNTSLPQGVSFVGLVQDEWKLFVVDASGVRAVRTAGEPRTPTYAAPLARAAYISAAGELREIDLKTNADVVLLQPSRKVAYTQPAYRPRSDELYVVALRDGSSIETDIVRVDRKSKQAVTVLQQRSAQFEPAFSADGAELIYSSVSCASECPKVLQEIWTMNVVGGIAEQRTLLNAISRQAVSSGAGEIVFVSNARGAYALWRSARVGHAEPMLQEAGLAESPVVTDTHTTLYIKRTQGGGGIVAIGKDGAKRTIALAPDIKDVRDLRWGGK